VVRITAARIDACQKKVRHAVIRPTVPLRLVCGVVALHSTSPGPVTIASRKLAGWGCAQHCQQILNWAYWPLSSWAAQGRNSRRARGWALSTRFCRSRGIGETPDQHPEGIHLSTKFALWPSAHRWVGQGSRRSDRWLSAEQAWRSPPRRGDRCLTAGMAAADHDQLKGFGGLDAEGHRLNVCGAQNRLGAPGRAGSPGSSVPPIGPRRE